MEQAGTRTMVQRLLWLVGTATVALALPAGADVKAGVDAASRGDYETALAEWRGPAAAGDADAQFNLGQSYKLGHGVPADPAVAAEWFRKAAAQGHAQAGDQYGLLLYQNGDRAGALPWLEKSAARDERRSELVLGTMLFNGEGAARDWPRAYALVARAAQQGVPQGSTTLARMDKYVPEAQRRQGLALAKTIEARGRAAVPGAIAPSGLPAAPVELAGAPVAAAPISRPGAPVRAEPPAKPPSAAGGAWKVQLGVFRDPDNARGMWAQKGARVGGSAAYVQAGALTRLLATGFATKADAQRACARVGDCIVTR